MRCLNCSAAGNQEQSNSIKSNITKATYLTGQKFYSCTREISKFSVSNRERTGANHNFTARKRNVVYWSTQGSMRKRLVKTVIEKPNIPYMVLERPSKIFGWKVKGNR